MAQGLLAPHVVRLFVNNYPEYSIINLDKLTYAGNLNNLSDVEDKNPTILSLRYLRPGKDAFFV